MVIRDKVLLVGLVSVFSLGAQTHYLLEQLQMATRCDDTTIESLASWLSSSSVSLHPVVSQSHLPLVCAYPALRNTISHISLAELPTPVLSITIQGQLLFIKADDQTGMGTLFGGNKLRKLEFLLADARAHHSKTVITFGCAGSNHAVATAACAQRLGLNCICLLKSQPCSSVVQRNLLLHQYYGSQLLYYPTLELRTMSALVTFVNEYNRSGNLPYVIPTGASNALGSVGFVNAAFELKEQIQQGLIVEPDYLYLPVGSVGTMAGLLLGIKAAGLKTKIVGVWVQNVPQEYALKKLCDLFQATNDLLYQADSSFGLYELGFDDFEFRYDYAGTSYGSATPEGLLALQLFDSQGVKLDPTYSSKAAACFLEDSQAGRFEGATVLFWQTFCGRDFTDILAEYDFHSLPLGLQDYFTLKH